VIGPTGSGKTSSCLIPALHTHRGSAIVVSTKDDIKRHTLASRARDTDVIAWDPLGKGGEAWDMLGGCETWNGACERSEALVHAARLEIESSVGQSWDSHTDRALAPYMPAAAIDNQPPAAIYGWVASQRVDEPQRIIATAALSLAERDAALLDLRTASILSPEDRSSLAISLIRVLAPLRIPELARSLAGGFTAERLVNRDRPATLYVTVPADEQRRARAFVVALVEAAYLAAYRSGSETAFDPPLLFLIDEAAHTAPLRDLPQMAQVARDAGIRIATSWQDASQIQHRYGREQADTLIGASQTRIILPGCTDPATCELVRASIGDGPPERDRRRRREPLDPRRLDSKMLVSHRYDAALWQRRLSGGLASPGTSTNSPIGTRARMAQRSRPPGETTPRPSSYLPRSRELDHQDAEQGDGDAWSSLERLRSRSTTSSDGSNGRWSHWRRAPGPGVPESHGSRVGH
jgi:type IV secretion system protein VirD4